MFGDLFDRNKSHMALDRKESFIAFKDLHFKLSHFFIFSKEVNL